MSRSGQGHYRQDGFTLIELSIVLVIVGLIAGGVLVGQDLIRAAYVRAQISQIESYNTAVNTFYGKYQALPGDMNNSVALANGFAARGAAPGQGDGNGIIEGYTSGWTGGALQFGGETEMFWVDLSKAGLIEGGFTTNSLLAASYPVSATQVPMFMPAAKIGHGDFVYVWSGGWVAGAGGSDGRNYWGLSGVSGCRAYAGEIDSFADIPVAQAYSIDKKVDDGIPQSGRVLAMYDKNISFDPFLWAAGGGQNNSGDFGFNQGPVDSIGQVANGMAAGPLSCFDGSRGIPEQYSMQINNGAGGNCALSFQMQAGD